MSASPSDLVTSVGKAYQLVWAERGYLVRLALLPFLCKIIFFTIAYSYTDGQNLWRLSLIMVPAWIVEGWMLAHFVRLIALNQRWPFKPTGDRAHDLPVLQSRYRGVMGGALAFALTQLLIGGWFALLMTFVPIDLQTPPSEIALSTQAALAVAFLVGLALYGFRFLWLYLAAAIGMDVRRAAEGLTQGVWISFRLIGVWLLCAVPAMVVAQLFVGLILMLAGPDNALDAAMAASIVAKAAMDVVKNLLCAAAVLYVFQTLWTGRTR